MKIVVVVAKIVVKIVVAKSVVKSLENREKKIDYHENGF